jgi:hypothetical protein
MKSYDIGVIIATCKGDSFFMAKEFTGRLSPYQVNGRGGGQSS